MATPEEVASQPARQSPELRVLAGGLAVEEIVSVEPVMPQPFAELRATLDEKNWNGKTHEELQAIWETVSAYRGDLARFIHLCAQDHDEALQVLVWIKGLQRDRPPNQET